jgi:plastocyanin domain-containing protein
MLLGMTTDQTVVTLAGLAAIIAVNRYFLAGRPALAAAAGASGTQNVTVVVDSSYSPAVIEVQAGQPVRLRFDRRDTGSCTEEVVLGDFGIRRFLPTGKITTVQFTPQHPGTHEFSCGMGMIHGKLIVK